MNPRTANNVAGCSLLLAGAAMLTFLAADFKQCDLGEGCAPGWPAWLFYVSGALVPLALVVAVVFFVLARTRPHRPGNPSAWPDATTDLGEFLPPQPDQPTTQTTRDDATGS